MYNSFQNIYKSELALLFYIILPLQGLMSQTVNEYNIHSSTTWTNINDKLKFTEI